MLLQAYGKFTMVKWNLFVLLQNLVINRLSMLMSRCKAIDNVHLTVSDVCIIWDKSVNKVSKLLTI